VPGTQRIPKHFGGLTGRKRARREVSKTTEAPGQKQGFGHNLQAPGLLPRLLAAGVDGKPNSRLQDFATYSAAKRAGDKVVTDLAKGQATALSPGQASDALAAIQRLQRYFHDTGRRVSLLAGISEYCEAAGKLNERALGDAMDGYLSTVASVERWNRYKQTRA
jgi:hypothetical protein